MDIAAPSHAAREVKTAILNDLTRKVQVIHTSIREFSRKVGIYWRSGKSGLRHVKTRVRVGDVDIQPGWYQMQACPTDGTEIRWSEGTTSNYRCVKCKVMVSVKSKKDRTSHRTAEGCFHGKIPKVDYCVCPDGTTIIDCRCPPPKNSVAKHFKKKA